MTRTEKLRRAVAAAHHAADVAATAAWRARAKAQAVRDIALELAGQELPAALKAFVENESARLLNEAYAFECAGYDRRGDLYALAEFMGARER